MADEITSVSKIKTMREPGTLLTPLSAIRSRCLDCCCGSAKETALCTITNYHLWPLRFGSRRRAREIVAQERERLQELEGAEGQWANLLPDFTQQTCYATEHALRRDGDA